MSRERVTRFLTRGGVRIYRLHVETFPGHFNNVYLVLDGPHSTLFDVGSGLPDSNDDLRAAFDVLRERFGETIGLQDVEDVVVSHAHIDHFGHARFFADDTGARLHVHELDADFLEDFEGGVATLTREAHAFLGRAGLPSEARAGAVTMYDIAARMFSSVRVDRRLRDGESVNGYRVHHVPGHSAGQICLEVDGVLLAADHVLARITPHQSPTCMAPSSGLAPYLASLQKVRDLAGIRLALPGHEAEIEDVPARIDAIARHHRRRLAQVAEACGAPASLAAVTESVLGRRDGFDRLLALEETAAHVEYLVDHGELTPVDGGPSAGDRDGVVLYERRGR